MGAVELVVAVGGEYESGSTLDPADEELQHVERGLVRPVHVLDDQDRRRPRPQLAHERRRDHVRSGAALDELLELAARELGDVEQRPERPRREQGVAGAPQDPRARRAARRTAHETRLSDPASPPTSTSRPRGAARRRPGTHRAPRNGEPLEQLAPLIGTNSAANTRFTSGQTYHRTRLTQFTGERTFDLAMSAIGPVFPEEPEQGTLRRRRGRDRTPRRLSSACGFQDIADPLNHTVRSARQFTRQPSSNCSVQRSGCGRHVVAPDLRVRRSIHPNIDAKKSPARRPHASRRGIDGVVCLPRRPALPPTPRLLRRPAHRRVVPQLGTGWRGSPAWRALSTSAGTVAGMLV